MDVKLLRIDSRLVHGQVANNWAGSLGAEAILAVSDGAANDELRKTLIKVNNAKTTGDRVKLLGSIRPSQLAPEQPNNGEPRTGLSMGDHAAVTAKEWGIPREEQDQLALASHHNLAKAYDAAHPRARRTGSPARPPLRADRRRRRHRRRRSRRRPAR